MTTLGTDRLDGFYNGFESLKVAVGGVGTPERVMEFRIHLHLAVLSLSDTVSVLESVGVSGARSTIHNRVGKADLEPRDGRKPEEVALDETVVKVNGERFWMYMAVDPGRNVVLHVRRYPSRNIGSTRRFLRELQEPLEDTEFLRRWSAVAVGRIVRARDAFSARDTRREDPGRTCFSRGNTAN